MVYGSFQLEFVSISRVINLMTCYNSKAEFTQEGIQGRHQDFNPTKAKIQNFNWL